MSVAKLNEQVVQPFAGFDTCNCKKEDSVSKLVQEWVKICKDIALLQQERKSTYCFYVRKYLSENCNELGKKVRDYLLLGCSVGGIVGFWLTKIENEKNVDAFTGMELGAASGATMLLLIPLLSHTFRYLRWKDYREHLDDRQTFSEIMLYSPLTNEHDFNCTIDHQVPYNAYRSKKNPQQLYDYANLKNWIGDKSVDPITLKEATLNDFAPCIYTQALITSELKSIMMGLIEKNEVFEDLQNIYSNMIRDLKQTLKKNRLPGLDNRISFAPEYLKKAQDFLNRLAD